jgi:hypothetical protein
LHWDSQLFADAGSSNNSGSGSASARAGASKVLSPSQQPLHQVAMRATGGAAAVRALAHAHLNAGGRGSQSARSHALGSSIKTSPSAQSRSSRAHVAANSAAAARAVDVEAARRFFALGFPSQSRSAY